ncbi:hypothetical protein EJD97_023979 [Solanum chilense]|uniref:Uncharacterized protein n=1 Tax=Solanum chilense TaxID=4083 RepID=A0A6N2CK23_SOLCI|nr:hypothetical protein EJD97_023979 [Solanum chilense]
MKTTRMDARRMEEEGVNGEIPPQVKQASQGVQTPQGEKVPIVDKLNEISVVSPDMNNMEIRKALLALARAMTTHLNRGVEDRVNALESTRTSIFRDFKRMNPPIFLRS